MKSIEDIVNDVKNGDLIRFNLDEGTYTGYFRRRTKGMMVFSGFYGQDESSIALKNLTYYNIRDRSFEGKKVIGYKILERAEKKKRSPRRKIEEPIYLDTSIEGGIGGPFRDSLSRELAEEDEEKRRLQRQADEDARDPMRPRKEF